MFATCHLTYGQLSNFVRASLEVTRTIRNNKVHFTWGCSILLLKKEMVPETGYLFFQWFWHFINCLNSNHNTLSNELFSKFLSWFLYLGVRRDTGVFFVVFFFFALLLSHVTRSSQSLRACLRLTQNRWKTACSADPGLLNETKGSCFLFVFFPHIKTDGKNKLLL